MTKKIYARRIFKSTQLKRALDLLYKEYEDKGRPDYLAVSILLTCSAYLEAKLNDSLHDEAHKLYGEDFAVAIQALSLKNKLNILVPALTSGRFIINKNHFVYKRLCSLISIRNSIAHAKSETELIEVAEEDLVDVPGVGGIFKIPKQLKFPRSDATLSATKGYPPSAYLEAIAKLEKWFFRRCPDKLSKVEMVIARSKGGDWEEISRTMVKHL